MFSSTHTCSTYNETGMCYSQSKNDKLKYLLSLHCFQCANHLRFSYHPCSPSQTVPLAHGELCLMSVLKSRTRTLPDLASPWFTVWKGNMASIKAFELFPLSQEDFSLTSFFRWTIADKDYSIPFCTLLCPQLQCSPCRYITSTPCAAASTHHLSPSQPIESTRDSILCDSPALEAESYIHNIQHTKMQPHASLDRCVQTLGPGPRSERCDVCFMTLRADTPTLHHIDCSNIICTECLIHWANNTQAGKTPSCPFCREPLCNDNQQTTIYPVPSLTALRSVVGNEAFMTRALSERLSHRQFPIANLNAAGAHPNFASNEPLPLGSDDLHQPDLSGTTQNSIAAFANSTINLQAQAAAYNWTPIDIHSQTTQIAARTTATSSNTSAVENVDSILRNWTSSGYRYCEEYIFTEFSDTVRFYVPIQPTVRVLPSITHLRRLMLQTRVTADPDVASFWLENPSHQSTDVVRAWVDASDEESERVLSEIERRYDVRWCLWSDNQVRDPVVWAVPKVSLTGLADVFDVGLLTEEGEVEHLDNITADHMFEGMYGGRVDRELFDYWLTLDIQMPDTSDMQEELPVDWEEYITDFEREMVDI